MLWREKAAATSGRRRDVAALHTKRSGRSERLDIGDPATGSNFKCDGAREEERHRRSSFKCPQGGARALDTGGPLGPNFDAATPGRRRGVAA